MKIFYTFILMAMFAVVSFAQAARGVYIDNAMKSVGTTFSVPVSMDDGSGVSSFAFQLQYDPAILAPAGANGGCTTAETNLASHFTVVCSESPAGTLNVAASGPSPITGTWGQLVFLNFTVVGTGSGSSLFHFQNGFINPGASIFYDGIFYVD